MTEKELVLNALWTTMSKVIFGNIETGEIKYVKNLPEEEETGCTQAKTLGEHVRKVAAAGYVYKADVEGYLKHVELDYLQEKLREHKGSVVYSYRRKDGDVYSWFSYEIVKPKNDSSENQWFLFLGKRADSESCLMQDTMHMLSITYHKILRINLTSDSYEIIKTYEEEQNPEYGISDTVSAWFRNFALRGYVHEDDLEAYLLFTEIGSMRKRFAESKDKQELKYRRLIGKKFHWVSMYLIPSTLYAKEHEEIMLFIRDLGEIE